MTDTSRRSRRHRLGRVVKWAGTAVVAALIATNAASKSWHFACYRATGFELSVVAHAAWFKWRDPNDPLWGRVAFDHWYLLRNDRNVGSWFAWPGVKTTSHYQLVFVPLWLPTLIVVLPTALLWFRDRRRFVAGRCPRCGYDLAGNTTGVCPECGRAA